MFLKMERNLSKIAPYKPNKNWYAVQFNFTNPTIIPYNLDLFNGYTLSNIQTYPNPISNPSIVSATIPVGNNPSFTSYNTISNTIYVTNNGSNNVSVINSITNTVINTISVGNNPQGISYNSINNKMYVANVNSNDIYVIDCNSNTIVGTPIPVSVQPLYITYNPNNNMMYCACANANIVDVIDCNSNTVVKTIPVGTNPVGISLNPLNNTMYVINNGSNDVYVIDCNSNTVVGTPIPVGILSPPNCITYNSFFNAMYISCTVSNDVRIIDCNTNLFTPSIIPVGAFPFSLSYDSLTNKIYVASFSSNNISVIDCFSNSIIGSISVGLNPIGISYNSTNNTMYVSNNSSNDVSVITSLIPQVPYISGSTDYNEFLRELQNTPKRVGHMSLLVDNVSQQYVPYEILKRDANGNQAVHVKLPNTYLSPNQQQVSVCELSFGEKELILDNTTILSRYTILPTTSVKMVIYYDEIDKSDMLSEIIDYAKIADVKVPDGNSRTEEEIELRDFRPLTKPDWLKNFKVAKKITA